MIRVDGTYFYHALRFVVPFASTNRNDIPARRVVFRARKDALLIEATNRHAVARVLLRYVEPPHKSEVPAGPWVLFPAVARELIGRAERVMIDQVPSDGSAVLHIDGDATPLEAGDRYTLDLSVIGWRGRGSGASAVYSDGLKLLGNLPRSTVIRWYTQEEMIGGVSVSHPPAPEYRFAFVPRADAAPDPRHMWDAAIGDYDA